MLNGNALSSIFGYISLACWIIVYTPQLHENYNLQSGEGLSVLLLFSWAIGDLCGLIGAILGQLVPTVILLAAYFIMADLALLGQVYYYRWKRSRRHGSLTAGGGEQEPLLGRQEHTKEPESLTKLVTRYILCLLFVSAFGIGAWWADESRGQSHEGNTMRSIGVGTVSVGAISEGGGEDGDVLRAWVVQILGWTSALLYVGGTLPQMLKNLETRCEGLSLGLFVFPVVGSFAYTISICAKSMERDYLMLNASWLAGQIFTGVFDCIIVGQILFYRFTERGRAGGVVL